MEWQKMEILKSSTEVNVFSYIPLLSDRHMQYVVCYLVNIV